MPPSAPLSHPAADQVLASLGFPLSYIEGRRPWLIIEDALEEYVVKHYDKEHRRR